MPNILKWILILPAAFAGYYLISFSVAFLVGRTIGKIEAIPFEIRLLFEWIAFSIAGFAFVFIGKVIAPDYNMLTAIILFSIMIIVNITSPARWDCRLVQTIGSFVAIFISK